MLTKELYEKYSREALKYLDKAGIALTEEEKKNVQVAEFCLGCVEKVGLELVVYVNTERCCAKELALLPHQTCPEHRHAPIAEKNYPGKEETFRCRYGEVYLYIAGEPTENCAVRPPKGVYTVFHEIKLLPGEQYTMMPDTLHWFQAGADGAVVSDFSTSSYDECDIFTDPDIKRIPEIEE